MGAAAVVLDLDGVLTDTARLHEGAWKELFDPILASAGQPAFGREDYRRWVDGKPRMDGIRALLSARGIVADDARIVELAERKDALFHRRLDQEGVTVRERDVAAVRAWRGAGLATAIVSSSRNARRVLERAGLMDLAGVLVDGEELARLGLPGKPAPDAFEEAARRLKVDPSEAVAVEDAEAGVEAAVAAGYGLVVGVRDAGDREALREAGADLVVASLGDLELDDLLPGRDPDELPSALDANALESALGGREPLLVVSWDGALQPARQEAGTSWFDEALRIALQRCVSRLTVAIVSGRDAEDLRERVRVPRIALAGSHGLEILDAEGRHTVHEAARAAAPALDAAERNLRERVPFGGGAVERRRYSLVLRLTGVDPEGRRELVRVLGEAAPGLRARFAPDLVELLPDVDWDDGRALEHVVGVVGDGSHAPVYLGSDRADEQGFRRAEALGGFGILVGDHGRPTRARLRLSGPAEVRMLVEGLAGPEEAVDPWALRYDVWDPAEQPLREALCTLGNGVFATRGAFEEAAAGGPHYPGTYLAGGYNRLSSEIRGAILVNEDLVNWPNWLTTSFRRRDGEWLSCERVELRHFSQWLDLRRGVLERHMIVRDRDGNETELRASRLVSMRQPHLAALRWEITPRNWSGPMELRSGLDGTVRNAGVARYGALRGDHLVSEGTGVVEPDTMWLVTCTSASRVRMAMVARVRVSSSPERVEKRLFGDRALLELTVHASEGQTITLEKVVCVRTSRDHAISEPLHDAHLGLAHAGGYEDLLRDHARAWDAIWRNVDVELDDGNRWSQSVIRLYLFHLLQVISPHVVDRDVGAPARGLHGEAYRGHVFWDELFIFPFLTYTLPDLTRELLLYRYRRLATARCLARESGLRGALFPWQSGSNGREESQVLHLNPNSGRWVPDDTWLQRHIVAAVAFNVWRYYQTTDDVAFLSRYGAEMLLEVARLWASLATFSEEHGRWRILGVVGPDEYHTRYPGRDRPGLDDNAYTNVMAAWCLWTAEEALERLDARRRAELVEELGITDDERERWREISKGLRVPFTEEGLIAQFEGYDELEEFDWAGYRARYGDIQRLDRILEAEGDTVDRYKASKQADVLMLLYLFSADELETLFGHMGYAFDRARIPEHVDYYLRRTSHGSTLSRVVHAWVLARSDRARSWHLFQVALRSDVNDIQGGTTAEGIHLGAQAGVIDLLYRGYTGAVIREGVLWLDPLLPDELTGVSLRYRVRDAWLEVRVDQASLEIRYTTGWRPSARVGFDGAIHEVPLGESRRFDLGEQRPQVRPGREPVPT